MSTRRKIGLTVILLAVLALVVVVIIPRLADVDRYRPQVIARIEAGTGRSAAISRLSLTVIPSLSVRADDVAIGNPPGFNSGQFLKLQRVYAEFDPRALLRRQIVIRSLKLENPVLSLISNRQGQWNTESPMRPRARVQPAAWQGTPAAPASIALVQFEHGRVTVAGTLASGELGPPSFEAQEVSARLEDVNPEALGLHLISTMEGRTRGALVGFGLGYTWRPTLTMAVWDQSGVVSPAGAQEVAPPRGSLAARGSFRAESARFGAIQATNLKSALELRADGLRLNGLALQLFGGQITGGLLWSAGSQPPRYSTHLSLANIDVARALLAFPSATGKLTGMLDGQLDLTGWTNGAQESSADPLANKQGVGEVTVRDGTLPALRLNRDVMALMRNIIRTGSATADPAAFHSLSADFEIAGGEIHSRQISIRGNGIEFDASGALALEGAGWLDYKGEGRIVARQNGVGNLVAGLLGSKLGPGGKISFPFTLTGTLAAPHFDAPRSPILH